MFVKLALGCTKIFRGTTYGLEKGSLWLDIEEAIFNNNADDYAISIEDLNISLLSIVSACNTLSDILTRCKSERFSFRPTNHGTKKEKGVSHTLQSITFMYQTLAELQLSI